MQADKHHECHTSYSDYLNVELIEKLNSKPTRKICLLEYNHDCYDSQRNSHQYSWERELKVFCCKRVVVRLPGQLAT